MNYFYAFFLLFLLLNIAAAMVRLARGPSIADRLMAAQLFGSTGVAALLVLAELLNQPAMRNVALAFVLLAVMVVIGFVRSGVGCRQTVGKESS
jgi:multicomponent Na+:H+ antiporter subunit F